MRVRRATKSDCAALGVAMKTVVDEDLWLATQPPVTPSELASRLEAAVDQDGQLLLVLEEDGRLIGALGLNPTAAEGVLSLGMWIVREHRGGGGGRMLLEAALERRPPEAHKMELEAFPDNEAAIALYRSYGFEQEGLRRDHYRRRDGSLRSAVVMARLFTEPARREPPP